MKAAVVYVGIDVAKAFLDVAWEDGRARYPNDAGGRHLLIKWLKSLPGAVQVVCEASGGYEKKLLQALGRADLPAALVSATRVRHYARAAGLLAKTDEVDARLIAAFGAALHPRPRKMLSAVQEQLHDLEGQRRHLSRLIVAEQNRLAQASALPVQRGIRQLLLILRKQMAKFDQLIEQLISGDQTLQAKAIRLTSFCGVGKHTAALLLAQMPELGQINRAQVAALAGVAPFNRDSGTMRGKRCIYGGRRALRSGLYMAAVCAARHNHILAPFYQRLIAAGKPPKLALTAVMRKLLIALNSALATAT